MKNLCIMEDDIPRDGGMWAEHAATLFIYVNEWDKSIASGQLWSFCVQKPIAFHGLDDLLSQRIGAAAPVAGVVGVD